MFLQVFFRLVLGVFLVFVKRFAAGGWFFFALWDELVFEHARLQRAFASVESGAPRILGINRFAPRAMVPHDLQVAEIKRCCLSVRRVRVTVLFYEDAAGRGD